MTKDRVLSPQELCSQKFELFGNLLIRKIRREVNLRLMQQCNCPGSKEYQEMMANGKRLLDEINQEIEDTIKLGKTEAHERAMREMVGGMYLFLSTARLKDQREEVKRFNGEYSNCHLCVQYPESVGCTLEEISDKPIPIKCKRGLIIHSSDNCNYYELKIDDNCIEGYRHSTLNSLVKRTKILEEMIEEHLKAGDSK